MRASRAHLPACLHARLPACLLARPLHTPVCQLGAHMLRDELRQPRVCRHCCRTRPCPPSGMPVAPRCAASSPVGCGCAGHSDQRWLDAVTEQAALLSHVSNLFHTVPQVDARLPAGQCMFAVASRSLAVSGLGLEQSVLAQVRSRMPGCRPLRAPAWRAGCQPRSAAAGPSSL